MNEQAKKRGDALVAEANARLSSFSPLSILGFGASAKYSDAADKFKMAGNQYKLGSYWQESGNAFLKASENFDKVDEKLEAVNTIVEAAQAFKKGSMNDEAIETFNKAIESYNMSGRFSRSSQYLKEVAEIYESDSNFELAVETYKQCAQLYENDNKKSQAQNILLKVASILSGKMEDYASAGQIYLEVGSKSMESNLGKFAAKGHFFCYLLCLTAIGDCVAVSEGLEKCKSLDYSFGTSREHDLMSKLFQAMQDNDQPAYATACAEFDNISPLDEWKTALLLKGRQHLSVGEDNDDGGGDIVEENGEDGDDEDLL